MGAGVKTAGLVYLLLLVLLAAGCGGGDSGGPDVPYTPNWVYIDTNRLASLTESSSVEMYGKAYCDTCPPSVTAFGYCPSVSAPASTSVDVTWFNATTGSGGPAVHAIVGSCSCFLSYCTVSYSHSWAVYGVPLAMGENDVRARASYAGSVVEDSVIVTRVPRQVAGLTATAADGQVTLQWDDIPDATSYKIYWSENPDFTKSSGNVILTASNPYVHSGLLNDVTVYYLVTAVNGTFESATSEKVFATPGWPVTVLALTTASSEAREASLAVDHLQHIHVHYAFDECLAYSTLPNGLGYCSQRVYYNNYLSNQGGTPVVQALPPGSTVDANIVLTADETAHVSFATTGAVHGWLVDGSWQTEMADPDGWCSTSLAVDDSDRLHMAYFADAMGNEIRHASQGAGVWLPESIIQLATSSSCNTQTPGTVAVATDTTGAARIAYAGIYPGYGLFHARTEAGTWLVDTVATARVMNLALAVGPAGLGYIASVNADGYLWLARQDVNGVWTSATVNDEWASGQPALVVDGAGQPHVAYIGLGGQLRYATQVDGSWRILALDGKAVSGADLVLDTLGKVHIVYFGSGVLKYVSNR